MKIIKVESDSLAEKHGLRVGDEILSINGKRIEDKLDFQFYSAADTLEIQIKQNEIIKQLYIEHDFTEDLGITVEALTYRLCGNNCVFCFVYQNPDGLRSSLYIKDEDFRLSFLYGNYTTLTNAKQKDLQKIIEQSLSPQYVSIHATDHEVRKFLLGNKKNDKLLDKIAYLCNNQIEVHGQIVLCPEINDGDKLEKTITDLMRFYPNFKSIAIVPLGMTKHREGLTQLQSVNRDYANRFIDHCDRIREKCRRQLNEPFIYLSDEWYILAERDLPPHDYYDDFYQVENGVGLCREFIDTIQLQAKEFPKKLATAKKLSLVTAKSAAEILTKYLMPHLEQIENLETEILIINNQFFGTDITVAGLLTATDIYEQTKDKRIGDLIVLPPRILNPDGLFLDNWKLDDLQNKLNKKIILYQYDMRHILESLERIK